jgi:hypothetical protein
MFRQNNLIVIDVLGSSGPTDQQEQNYLFHF